MRDSVKTLVKILFFLLFIALPAAIFIQSPDLALFKIQSIATDVTPINGFETMSNDVKSKAAIVAKQIEGKYVWQTNVKSLRNQLMLDQRIANARVIRDWFGHVVVQLDLHQPQLLLARSAGRWQAVSRDGELLPAGKRFFDLPVLRGNSFEKDKSLRQKTLAWLEALPKEGPLSAKNISEIFYDSVEGFSFHLSEDPILVRLGSERLPLRIQLVQRVVNHLTKNEMQARVIDARFNQKVVVRLRNAP